MKKTLYVIGAVAVGVGAALLAWSPSEPSSSTSPGVPPGPALAGPTLAGPRHGCLVAPHQRYAWTLQTRTRATVAAASLGTAAVGDVKTRNEGTQRMRLEVEGLAALSEGSVLLGRLVDVDASTLEVVPGLSQTPFLFKVSSRCEVVGFGRHRSSTLLAARTQQATLAQLRFRIPEGEGPERVKAENGLGAFSAVVARDADVVQRRVVAYERAWVGAEVPTVGDSFLSVQLGDGAWFESMRGEDAVSQGLFSDARASLQVARAQIDPSALTGASRDEQVYVWENLLPRFITPTAAASQEWSVTERAQRAALQHQPLTAAVREFAAAVASEPNADRQWKGLTRYFEVHPEAIGSFVGAMRQPDFPRELKAMGFVAVGHATPSEAREALMVVRDDTAADPFDRLRATLALVGRGDVGADLAALLRRDSRAMVSSPKSAEAFYGRNALLALGMFSGLRQNEDDAVKEEARGAIAQALEASELEPRGEPAVTFPAAMGAMGILGDPADLPRIIELSKHPNPEVRALVPQAMRRLTQRTVADFTLEWLSRETSPAVKQELYSVIQHQLLDEHLVATEALARLAVRDLSAQPLLLTRQPLIRMLGPVAARFAFVREALVAQATKEVGTTSGLYSVIAQYVPGDQVAAALAKHPSFSGEGRLLVAVPGPAVADRVQVAP